MNVNEITKKALEWFAVGTAGFYVGVGHVANLAYDGLTLQPEWVQQISNYETIIMVSVVLATSLWIGLDYVEYRLTE